MGRGLDETCAPIAGLGGRRGGAPSASKSGPSMAHPRRERCPRHPPAFADSRRRGRLRDDVGEGGGAGFVLTVGGDVGGSTLRAMAASLPARARRLSGDGATEGRHGFLELMHDRYSGHHVANRGGAALLDPGIGEQDLVSPLDAAQSGERRSIEITQHRVHGFTPKADADFAGSTPRPFHVFFTP